MEFVMTEIKYRLFVSIIYDNKHAKMINAVDGLLATGIDYQDPHDDAMT